MDSRKPRDVEWNLNDWNYNIIVHCNGNPTVAEMLKSTQALTVTSLANAEGLEVEDTNMQRLYARGSGSGSHLFNTILKDCCI